MAASDAKAPPSLSRCEVSSPPKPVVARFLRGSRSRVHEPLASTCPMFLSDCIGGARAVGP